MLRAIIFDMDGVVCDSEPLHMKAFQSVLQEEGRIITDQEYYDRYLAHDDRGSFEAALGHVDAQKMKSLLARKARIFEASMKEHLVIYPGIDTFVRKAEEKYLLALASGARRLEVEYVLKKAKIRESFAAVVSADDVTDGKPKPEAFQKALEQMNLMRLEGTSPVQAAQCAVIEDSPRCIRTANELGMKSVGMATSYKADDLKEAHLVISTLVGFELAQLERLF